MAYSFLDYKPNVPCPPRAVNGGLYTGKPAQGNWGNYPVIPEPHILAENLLSANPPPIAAKQPVSFNRPGNNYVKYPYHIHPNKELNIKCIAK